MSYEISVRMERADGRSGPGRFLRPVPRDISFDDLERIRTSICMGSYLEHCPKCVGDIHFNETYGCWHCFECGAGGNIFSYFMSYYDISYLEAVGHVWALSRIRL